MVRVEMAPGLSAPVRKLSAVEILPHDRTQEFEQLNSTRACHQLGDSGARNCVIHSRSTHFGG